MTQPRSLSKLEYYVPDHCSDDIEPLWIIYMETKRDFKDFSQVDFVGAIVFLAERGLLNAYFNNYRVHKYEPIVGLTREHLFTHLSGRSENELIQYPSSETGGEYYIEMTDSGRAEHSKDEYDQYYPE